MRNSARGGCACSIWAVACRRPTGTRIGRPRRPRMWPPFVPAVRGFFPGRTAASPNSAACSTPRAPWPSAGWNMSNDSPGIARRSCILGRMPFFGNAIIPGTGRIGSWFSILRVGKRPGRPPSGIWPGRCVFPETSLFVGYDFPPSRPGIWWSSVTSAPMPSACGRIITAGRCPESSGGTREGFRSFANEKRCGTCFSSGREGPPRPPPTLMRRRTSG